jgi:superfamily II DNA or RNA helicase
MRINLSLLEGTAGNRERLAGAELWRQGRVLRIARSEPDEPLYEVLVGDDRETADTVTLRLDQGDQGPWLESWQCSCPQEDECCAHAVAAALALQHNLEQAQHKDNRGGKGTWRTILTARGTGAGAADKASWICYDLSLASASGGELQVGVVRRKRSLSDRGKRSAGAVVGWTPTAVGHFGYRTADDAAQNRDDLIPVLCLVNRHDLRVRTIQPGFIDVFLRLFVDAEEGSLRVDGEDAKVDGEIRPVTVLIQDTPGGGLELRAQVQSHAPGRSGDDYMLLPGPVPWLFLRAEQCFVRPDCSAKPVLQLLKSGVMNVTSAELQDFIADALPMLRSEVTLIERTSVLPQARIASGVPVVKLEEQDDQLVVSLVFAYRGDDHEGLRKAGDRGHEVIEFRYGHGPKVFSRSHVGGPVGLGSGSAAHTTTLWQRDHVVEQRWHARLSRAVGANLPASLPMDEALDFLSDHLPMLQRDGAEVVGQETLLKIRPSRHTVVPQVKIRSGIDWFGVQVALQAGDLSLTLAEVIAAWRQGARYIRLQDGEMARLPVAWLRRHAAALTDLEELAETDPVTGEKRVATFLAPALAALATEHQAGDDGWRSFVDKLDAFVGIPERALPPGFAGELRPYQQRGYEWLCALRDLGLHGCLADDMGLGKTIQTLALLQAEVVEGRAVGPSLVIAPTSVVQNWADEAAKFTPDLKVLVLRGGAREERLHKLETLREHHVIITSYALLRLDQEWLTQVQFHYCILDEAQAIKNASSQTAQAARALRAKHRLTLTGTPLENNLMELWSQYTFLMPGFFGTRARFLRRYGVEKAGELQPELLDQLRQRLRPFLLRRLKTDVLTELPPVTELTLRCTLAPPQRQLYERVRNTYRAQVLTQIEQVGVERSALTVLEALLRLRQACCHPELLPFEEARNVRESAKTELFLQTLEELLAEGRRILVFSQWTSMLKILRKSLTEMGIETAYLDGATRDRAAVIARAQADDGPPVFLVSLKAGGVGLNLTAADVVIHYDPWWNPAVEQQASDRVHRIGQTKPVLVLRLAVEDSVEDSILALQSRKKALAQSAIESESDGVKQLTRADLEAILGDGAGPRLRNWKPAPTTTLLEDDAA